ncbi:MAG: TGS domain-containing protein, partial [Candidatus Hadarchaeales archaeon]
KLKEKGYLVVPTCAEAELVLRRAAEKGIIDYAPGEKEFKIKAPETLTEEQKNALKKIDAILKKHGSTGVQEVVDKAVTELLGLIVVYPVDDENKLMDKKGNVLPDAFLVPRGTTAKEFAYKIHSELGDSFLYAIDARTKRRVGEDYQLKDGDVIKIVATRGR